MADDSVKLSIEVVADVGSIARAERELQKMERVSKDVALPFDTIAQKSKKAAKTVADSAKEMTSEVETLADVLERVNNKIDETNQKKVGNTLKGTLGTLSSATGISELGDVGNVASSAQGAVSALKGLPAVLGAMSPAALALTVALGGVALIIAGVTAALAIYNDSMKNQVATIKAASNARREADELSVSGTTKDDVEQELERLNALREKAYARQLRAQEEYDQAQFNLLEKFGSDVEQARAENIQAEIDAIIVLEERIKAFREAIDRGDFDASTQNQRWADEAKQRVKDEQDLQKAMQESQRAQEKAVKDAERAKEKAARESAKAAKEAEKAAKDAAKALQDKLKKGIESVGQAAEQVGKEMLTGISEEYLRNMAAMVKSRQEQRRKEAAEAAELRNELIKMANEYTQKEIDARQEAYEAELDATIKQQRELQKIKDAANKKERDAIRSGDIFAIRDIREGLAESLRESAADFNIARQDRATAASKAEQDRLNDYQQRRAEAQGITFNITNADPMQTAMIVQQQIAKMRR